MGFFSSIGGILGGIAGAVLAPATGGASLLYPLAGSAIGGSAGAAVDANQANKKAEGYYNQQMDFAQQQAQFQQDYAKNVMQWRVEDAKNAGVHPMAALGISNPSYSPVSAPSAPSVYDSGQFDTGSTFGQSLNRASMQAKTMEQQEQAASLGFQQIGLQNKGLELDNQYKALQVAQLASELQRNAASSAPAPKVNNPSDPTSEDLFTFGVDGNGKKSRVYPTDFMTSTWEDRPAGTSLAPLAEAEKLEQDAKLTGAIVNNHVWFPSRGEFVQVNSRDGQRALAYWRRVGSVPRSQRALVKYPRENMNRIDKAFFDWIDRTFN